MAKKIQDGKLLYHITAIENLPKILENGLLSRQDLLNKNLLQKDVADKEIIAKREELEIDKCVPFHFFEPTPFAGSVFNDPNNSKNTFICIAITREFARQQNFKICTAHPLSKNPKAEIKSYDEGLKSVDWENAEKRDYTSDISKNACMAECLADKPIMPENFSWIYVYNNNDKKAVENLIKKVNESKDKNKQIKTSISINEKFTKSGTNHKKSEND